MIFRIISGWTSQVQPGSLTQSSFLMPQEDADVFHTFFPCEVYDLWGSGCGGGGDFAILSGEIIATENTDTVVCQ